jgi:transcriptional regulator with XRE-family HTH domain
MLGTLIKARREQRGLSPQALAQQAQVSLSMLTDVEAERLETLDDSAVLRIANLLAPTAEAYAELCDANAARRFRAYGVGLPKTGTTSIAAIFGAFRSAHEGLAHETYRALAARAHGSTTEADFRDFLRWRDVRAALEMDSAGFHHAYIPLLVQEFPDARFVLTVRDCFSWLDSLVRYVLDAGPDGGAFVGWGREQLGLPFDLPYRDATSRERLRPTIASCLSGFLRYFRDGNRRVLAAVPEARLLVVRTSEISQSLASIARFVGMAEEALDRTCAHQLQAPPHPSLLRSLDRATVESLFEGVEDQVMLRYFPTLSLRDYLAGADA